VKLGDSAHIRTINEGETPLKKEKRDETKRGKETEQFCDQKVENLGKDAIRSKQNEETMVVLLQKTPVEGAKENQREKKE